VSRSAYVFTKSRGTFKQASQVLPPAGTSDAEAGQSVGISSNGSVVAFGAGHLHQDAGAVFVATKTNGIFAVTATDTAANATPTMSWASRMCPPPSPATAQRASPGLADEMVKSARRSYSR